MATHADDAEFLAAMRAAGWRLPTSIASQLSAADREFMRIEMTGPRTRDYYARRLQMIGFTGGECVLDAACGIGQWSLALAECFHQVVGVDINRNRLDQARAFAAEEGRSNCTFREAALEQLPLNDGACDAVFCYGAFMFTEMPGTLAEFRRVLRPGGRLYLNANSTGWCAHLFFDRGLRCGNLGLARAAARMATRTLLGRTSHIVVRRRWLKRAVTVAGFRVLAIGAEGTVRLASHIEAVPPAYASRFYGMTGILELVAEG